jgi:predicted ABC-type transport system involved in lysophospholipase L1 biosynthesis ATPase subunit
MPAPIIAAEAVSKVYGSGTSAVTALTGVQLSVEAGERVAILGKSGSGKSTLMNLIGGLDVPTTGTLRVAGQNLGALSRRQLADYRLARVGFVFQSFHLIPTKTVAENVELPLVLAGRPAAERRQRAREVLAAVGLDHRLDHRPTQLSGGERQRTAVARALVNRPAVLLADEPTGNLDSSSAAAVMDLLFARVRDHGMTLLLVTHDEELAKRYAGRVVRVQDGRVEG